MDPDEELRKPYFQNEWHHLRVNLLQSANWLRSGIREFVEPFGITQKQFNILRILRGQPRQGPGLTIQEIRSKMIDKMSDASRLVDRLKAKGLVEKEPCVIDRRHARVRITRAGLELLADIDQALPRLDRLVQNLTESEAMHLNDLLYKMQGRDGAANN